MQSAAPVSPSLSAVPAVPGALTDDVRAAAADHARAGATAALLDLVGGHLDVPSLRGDSWVMLAAYHGHAQTVRALLAQGARGDDRGARGLSPLDGAAFHGFVDVIDALVGGAGGAGGVDVDGAGPDGRTALMWAASFNRVDAVRRLLALGASPTRVDARGLCAADHAAAMGAVDAVDVLARLPGER